MRKPIRQYWPDYYHAIIDFIELADTQDAELDTLAEAIEQLQDDRFVLTSGTAAVKRRETVLGIQANPAVETLDFRKLRIVNRYSTKPPFTVRVLQQQLDRLVGAGITTVSADVQQFVLDVTVDIDNAAVFRELQHTVETVKPANMVYRQRTGLLDRIVLTEHVVQQPITWNCVLDEWTLGEPFVTLGAEVEII